MSFNEKLLAKNKMSLLDVAIGDLSMTRNQTPPVHFKTTQLTVGDRFEKKPETPFPKDSCERRQEVCTMIPLRFNSMHTKEYIEQRPMTIEWIEPPSPFRSRGWIPLFEEKQSAIIRLAITPEIRCIS